MIQYLELVNTVLEKGVIKKNSSYLIYNLSILSLFGCLALILNFPINTNVELFNNSYKIDYLSSFMKILTVSSGIFVLISLCLI